MTLQESVNFTSEFAARVNAIYKPFIREQERFNRLYSAVSNENLIKLVQYNEQMQETCESWKSIMHNAGIQKLYDSIHLPDNLTLFTHTDLHECISKAAAASIPYLPEEQQELVRETVAREIDTASPKRLTLEQLVTLVSLLITILTYISCCLPDPQLDELIELQKEEIAIEQQAQESANKNSDDLQNTISTLSETICVLNNEIEVLSEQAQEMNNLEDSNVQSDNGQVLNDDHEP